MIQLTHAFIAEFISFVLNCPDRSVRLSPLLTVYAALWPSQNQNLVTLTIKEKANILKEKDKGKSYRQLAEPLGVSKKLYQRIGAPISALLSSAGRAGIGSWQAL